MCVLFFFFCILKILTICKTADFDLTGQLVWPGAMLLNDYLSKNAEMLQGCSMIELGSGVGESYLLFLFSFAGFDCLKVLHLTIR